MSDWVVSKVAGPSSDQQSPVLEDKSPKDGGSVTTETNIKPPLTEYAKLRNRPYTLDYFKMQNFQLLGPLYDKHYRPKVDAIDAFVQEEVSRNKLVPTTESYDRVMGKIFKELGITPNDLPDKVLERILTYAKVIGMQRKFQSKIREDLDKINKRITINYD